MTDIGNPKERAIVNALVKAIDTLDLDMPWIAFLFAQREGTAMQMQMHKLCMGFIRYWAGRYDSGSVRPEQYLYGICEQCHHMVKALDAAQDKEYNSPRARRLRRQQELAEKSS